MKRRYVLEIRGKYREWIFIIWEDPRHVNDWQADGLNISPLINTIPQWWVYFGLPAGLYCWLQDFIALILGDT